MNIFVPFIIALLFSDKLLDLSFWITEIFIITMSEHEHPSPKKAKTVNESIWVIMDSEPDDLAALLILNKKYPGDLRVVIAGKSNDNEHFDRTQIGLDFCSLLDPPLAEKPILHEVNSDELADEALRIMESKPRRIVWICSFLSLFKAYKKNPLVFKENSLWAYGSVNLRWAYKNLEPAEQTLFFEMLNKGFDCAAIFETYFAFGEKNSSHSDSTPNIAELLKPYSGYSNAASFVGETMIKWNSFSTHWIYEKLEKELPDLFPPGGPRGLDTLNEAQKEFVDNDSDEKSATKTTTKILRNMILHRNFQMVFADHGMALAVVCSELKDFWVPKRAALNSDGFIELKESEEGDTLNYFVTPEEDRDGIMSKFDLCMKNLFDYPKQE